MMMLSRFGTTLCALTLLISAQVIAAPVEHTEQAWPAITSYTKARISVVVVDARESVISGKKTPQYVGALRTSFGIPISMTTATNRPLAEDLAAAISSGFNNAGNEAKVVSAGTTQPKQATAAGEKLLLVTLKEWASDSYGSSVGIQYKLSAEVLDQFGQTIASNTAEGSTKTFTSPIEAGRAALTELLTAPQIAKGLSEKVTSLVTDK